MLKNRSSRHHPGFNSQNFTTPATHFENFKTISWHQRNATKNQGMAELLVEITKSSPLQSGALVSMVPGRMTTTGRWCWGTPRTRQKRSFYPCFSFVTRIAFHNLRFRIINPRVITIQTNGDSSRSLSFMNKGNRKKLHLSCVACAWSSQIQFADFFLCGLF